MARIGRDCLDAYVSLRSDDWPIDWIRPGLDGAPLRVRVERQLGYKMAKYIRAIELVASFEDIGVGRGSLWANHGYARYAGI